MNRVINGNIISFARHYHGDPFHAILCDPPYHLTSIVKRFSENEPEHTKTAQDIKNRSTPHARQAAGFMGKKWDGGDIAFKSETWKALADLLYPGAFIFSFAGTRGYHRMAVSMEDAGLIIHPAIGWVFGSGFPKATRIDTQLENGEEWKDYRYGLQALKPAFEFIAVAQKPYKGRSVDCITKTGAGALNIEGARISLNGDVLSMTRPAMNPNADPRSPQTNRSDKVYEYVNNKGRWPANFALCHSPECERECVDKCPVKMMDYQSGDRPGFSSGGINGAGFRTEYVNGENKGNTLPAQTFNDSGGASRFFFNADYLYDRFESSDPVMYQAKAGNSERDAGLESRSTHPTHKPISLCKWLATLLLPPDSYSPRRLLIPFSGAGSEMIGATLAGWDQIVGVEMESEYAVIARARLAWWEQKLTDGHTDLDRMLKQWNRESESEQSESEDEQLSLL